MKTYSIRTRLVSGTLASMLVIFGIVLVAAHYVARHESEEIFSARLATSARVLEALVARQIEKATITAPIVITLPPALEQADSDHAEKYGHPYETKIAFQIWNEEGKLLAKSASAPSALLGQLVPGFSKRYVEGQAWQVFTLRSGRTWIVAAEKDEVRSEVVSDLGTAVLIPLIAGGVLMLLAVNYVLSINMASLNDLAQRISKREPESLAQINLPQMPVELIPIVDELNDLLRRVSAAFEREQRFIDAAAHEIRTPLAALQIHVQNALRANDAQEREHSLSSVLQALQRTINLAEQLLTFSRLKARLDRGAFQPLSLNQLCREVITLQAPVLEQKGQTIGLDALSDRHTIVGELHQLQRLLLNLIDNASRYGAPRGDIEVALWEEDGKIVLQVANEGLPIPESEVDKIFVPYYRIPGAVASGSGLGLAIVKEIAEQHQASVSVASKSDGKGVAIKVVFPSESPSR